MVGTLIVAVVGTLVLALLGAYKPGKSIFSKD